MLEDEKPLQLEYENAAGSFCVISPRNNEKIKINFDPNEKKLKIFFHMSRKSNGKEDIMKLKK